MIGKGEIGGIRDIEKFGFGLVVCGDFTVFDPILQDTVYMYFELV